MTAKLDFKKDLKHLYAPGAKPSVLTVPPMTFLMIDGEGAPESEAFADAVEALFSVAYHAKFAVRKVQGVDFGVMPLEGLWWADDMDDFVAGRRDNWRWTLMIMQPPLVGAATVEASKAEVIRKKKLAAAERLRLEAFEEGLCAQVLHVGPFSEEGPTIAKLHEKIEADGGGFDGHRQKHHEIYLGDFRKTAPEKLKTILRQPFVTR